MKTLDELPSKIDHEKIAAFCREGGMQKMSLFGSVVREDFDRPLPSIESELEKR
jgi:predicted nucleotidyltransferase